MADGLMNDLISTDSEGQGGRGTLDYLRIVSDPGQTALQYRRVLADVEQEYLEFSRPPMPWIRWTNSWRGREG